MDAATAQRRINNANNPNIVDPDKRDAAIAYHTKLLNEANARMTAIEAQLKDKGAAPR
jgi:hypothetical protein